MMLLVSGLTIFPLAVLRGAGSHLPHHYQNYLYLYGVSTTLSQISTLHVVKTFDSPVTVGILNVPKGIAMTLLHGGVLKAHPNASRGYYTTALVTLLCLIGVLPDIRYPAGTSRPFYQNGSASFSRPLDISPRNLKLFSLASFLPLITWLLFQDRNFPAFFDIPIARLREQTPILKTVDIVVSYYDEPFESLLNFTQNLRYYPWIRQRDPRFILYLKNDKIDAEDLRSKINFDEVVRLENRGREAGSYLRHILSRYNTSIDPTLSTGYRSGLADHTLFFQGHLGWEWLAQERMWLFRDNTGYLHLAPYVRIDCGGNDIEGNGYFRRFPQIYSTFRERVRLHFVLYEAYCTI